MASVQNLDVEDLARRAATGDPAALHELLEKVRPDVLRVCGRFLPYREDAEEACQDALLAVARGITRFEGRSAFRTWMYRLAANRALSTYDRLRRQVPAERVAQLPERADPRRTSVIAGTRLDLLDALAGLRPEFAEAVALRDVVGLGYPEIAALQNVPEGTVKSRIHEARRRLRERLADGG